MKAEETLGDIKLMLNKLDTNIQEEATNVESTLSMPDEYGNINLDKHSGQISNMLAQASQIHSSFDKI